MTQYIIVVSSSFLLIIILDLVNLAGRPLTSRVYPDPMILP